jgi:hypothetical protein
MRSRQPARQLPRMSAIDRIAFWQLIRRMLCSFAGKYHHLSQIIRSTMQEGRGSPCCGIPCCENTDSLFSLKCGHNFCKICLMAQKKNRPRKPASMYALFNASQACSANTHVLLLPFEQVCCSPIVAEPVRTEVACCTKMLFHYGALFVEASFFCGPRNYSCMRRLRRLHSLHAHSTTAAVAQAAAVTATAQAARACSLVMVPR